MSLNPLPVANEATLVESNVLKLEELEESPLMTMKKSSTSGGYRFSCLNNT